MNQSHQGGDVVTVKIWTAATACGIMLGCIGNATLDPGLATRTNYPCSFPGWPKPRRLTTCRVINILFI